MARQILPIAGSTVSGYFGRPSWWRRALIRLAKGMLNLANATTTHYYVGGPVLGEGVDPGEPVPAQPEHLTRKVGDGLIMCIRIGGASSSRSVESICLLQGRGSR